MERLRSIRESIEQNPYWGIWKLKSPKNEIWAEKGESFEMFPGFLNHAQKEIKIVCGELHSQLYESEKVIELFTRLLKSPNSKIEIAFFKDDLGDIKSVKEKLEKENPKLVALEKEYKERLKLYWVKTRPIQHYAVIDDRDLFFEEPHMSGVKRRALFRYDDPILGNEWQKRFDRYIKNKGELVTFE